MKLLLEIFIFNISSAHKCAKRSLLYTKVIALCVRYREAIETIISDILHGRRQREVILKDYAELEHLLWMISEIEDVSNHMSLTKRHRWLGYVQTVLIFVYGYSDVETERYATRDILKGS